MSTFPLPGGRTLVVVRLLTLLGRVGPLFIMGGVSLWMAQISGGAVMYAVAAILVVFSCLGASRSVVMVRQGEVRPGFSRRWLTVGPTARVEVRPSPPASPARIVLADGESEHTLAVCASPIWDSSTQHESVMTAACRVIARACRRLE
ncbi:MAG: hypothetical protein R2697_04865 [Ilumatobacteraceae bacterium]